MAAFGSFLVWSFGFYAWRRRQGWLRNVYYSPPVYDESQMTGMYRISTTIESHSSALGCAQYSSRSKLSCSAARPRIFWSASRSKVYCNAVPACCYYLVTPALFKNYLVAATSPIDSNFIRSRTHRQYRVVVESRGNDTNLAYVKARAHLRAIHSPPFDGPDWRLQHVATLRSHLPGLLSLLL